MADTLLKVTDSDANPATDGVTRWTIIEEVVVTVSYNLKEGD